VCTAFQQECVPLEEVFEELRTSRYGLTTVDAEARLTIFGPNKLEEKPVCFTWPTTGYVLRYSSIKPMKVAHSGVRKLKI